MEVLAFEVADRRAAIPLALVQQIARMVHVMPLPGAPAGVDGAITVHGASVPVFDLARLLGFAQRPIDPDEHLLLVHVGGKLAALRVTRALKLLAIDQAQLDEAAARAPGITYIAQPEEPLLLLHDLEALLGSAPGASRERPASR